MPVPWLSGAYVVPELAQTVTAFPFTLPFARTLDVKLDDRVTVFVGENGTGKSTVIEALAELVGLPWDGGSQNEVADSEKTSTKRLAHFMRPVIRNKAPNKYFFRAEALSDFGRLLDEREADPDFWGDPYALYGGSSIRNRSHGEATKLLIKSHDRRGLYFFDEPENALSPKAQLDFVKLVDERVDTQQFQFVIATHSPIVMSIKRARIIRFDTPDLNAVKREETNAWKTYASLFAKP
ncbi:MAG: AAA family ATPase [Archangium sp.]